MYCLQYDESPFSIANDNIEDLYPILFSFFLFKRNLTVYTFDTFFPDYLQLDKNNEKD